MGAINYLALTSCQRVEHGDYATYLALRVHRALSWLNRVEQADDPDGSFLFLRIAFNAAGATEIDELLSLTEQLAFTSFPKKLCDLDSVPRIKIAVWQESPGAIRSLLTNPFIFQSFWDSRNGKIEEKWQEHFAHGKRRAAKALVDRDAVGEQVEVFYRLYTVSNQLIHSGAVRRLGINWRAPSTYWASRYD